MDSRSDLEIRISQLEEQISKLIAEKEETVSKYNERLAIEDDLRESQEKFTSVFYQSSVANKIINSNLKIIELNQALCDLLGYSQQELLGSVILDYTHPEYIKHWHDLQEALWARKLPSFQLEARLIKKDKTEVWVLVNTVLFKDKNETLGYTSLDDITGRKQLERHKDEFISTISHELKTPLTSIKSYSQLLLRHFKEFEDTKPLDMLRKMDSKVNSLTELIKQLVMASKIESGKLSPKSEEYRVDELLAEIVEEFKMSVSTREITLESNPSIKTKGDRNKIEQVISNLLTNAIKFSASNTPIRVTSNQSGNEVIVCIQDYGRGLTKDQIELIFNRFYKVREAENNMESGMGLGLYICSEIIRNQQGKLWVDSQFGKGSTFCFSLPVLR